MQGIKPYAGLLLARGAASVSAQDDNSDGVHVYSVGRGSRF